MNEPRLKTTGPDDLTRFLPVQRVPFHIIRMLENQKIFRYSLPFVLRIHDLAKYIVLINGLKDACE